MRCGVSRACQRRHVGLNSQPFSSWLRCRLTSRAKCKVNSNLATCKLLSSCSATTWFGAKIDGGTVGQWYACCCLLHIHSTSQDPAFWLPLVDDSSEHQF